MRNFAIPLLISIAAHGALFLGLRPGEAATDRFSVAPMVRVLWQEEAGDVPPVCRVGDMRQLRTQEKRDGAPALRDESAPDGTPFGKDSSQDDTRSQPQLRGDARESMVRYQDAVKQRLEALRRYPAAAWRARVQGEARVRFVVLDSGACTDITVVRSAGSPLLDEAAEETVRRAAPFPPLPAEMGADRVVMHVALVYRVE